MKTMESVHTAWIQSLSSKNTKKKYYASVETFFDEVFGLTPKELTKENFEQLSYSLVISRFVQPLKEKGVKESTIKAHLAAVRSFMNAVEREEIFPDVNFAKIIKLSLTIKSLKAKDAKATEPISESELKELEAWVKSYYDDERGLGYAWLVDLMFKTAIRVEAAVNIKWCDFVVTVSPYGGEWSALSVIDKGKKLNTKYLPIEYYNELKEVFYKGDDQGEVFEGLTSSVLRRLMKEFSDETGKNLTPHSIKAGAATTLYARTHDMMMVRDFCDHTSISVTERYIHMTKDPNKQGTAMLAIDCKPQDLDKMTKEELLAYIHSAPEVERTVWFAAKKMNSNKIS